jgi:hypothetical protein
MTDADTIAAAMAAKRAAVDFRILDLGKSKSFIVWRDGRREYVSNRKLKALEAKHTWMPDW